PPKDAAATANPELSFDNPAILEEPGQRIAVDECQGAHAQPRRHQIFDPLEEGTVGSLGPGNVLPAAFAQVVIKPTVIAFAHIGVALLTDAFDHRQPALPGLDQGTIAPCH